MEVILSTAIIITLVTAGLIVLRYGQLRCTGPMPVSTFTFVAILFTSGLDVGLIMFPLTEFPAYTEEPVYDFANPLAIEFGFWGFLVWVFYFLTAFYFVKIEPQVQLFEKPVIKFVNNLVIIATCAFTGFLFLDYLPSYVEGITEPLRFGLVAAVVLAAVLSSTNIHFVKILSLSSTWLFFALIAGMWLASGAGVSGFAATFPQVGAYFTNIHRFVLPISELHEFYLFWWFAWSIMIGQFVARFVGGLKTWKMLLAMVVIPSIPLAVWFSVLYIYYTGGIDVGPLWQGAMVTVGIIFVVNSLDSLIRLYTVNLNLTPERFGRPLYVAGNFGVMFGLVLLYQFTPLRIEWIGLIVIGLYTAVYVMLFRRRGEQIVAAG